MMQTPFTIIEEFSEESEQDPTIIDSQPHSDHQTPSCHQIAVETKDSKSTTSSSKDSKLHGEESSGSDKDCPDESVFSNTNNKHLILMQDKAKERAELYEIGDRIIGSTLRMIGIEEMQ
jgi:hypothetical protein